MARARPPIHTTDSRGRAYLRVTVNDGGRKRSVWAVRAGADREAAWSGGRMVRAYAVLDKHGSAKNELYIVEPCEVLDEQPAQIDCRYGWLEVI